jgi:ethanolamine utilization protein EutA (predicted chaperonin)
LLLKKAKKQLYFDPSKNLSLIQIDLNEEELAGILDKIDLSFFSTLKLTDFLNFDFLTNMKFQRYLEYQKALYQIMKSYLVKEHPVLKRVPTS